MAGASRDRTRSAILSPEDWELTDPAGQGIEVAREVRDDIKARIAALISDLLPAR